MSAEEERGWFGPPAGAATGGWRWLKRLASLRFTLVILALVGAAVLWAYYHPGGATWPMVGPLALFFINLTAALAVHPAFRHHLPLLVFHLALLAVIVLVAVGRLTYLKGHVEIGLGDGFPGELDGFEAGPLHAGNLHGVRFVNEGFTIEYAPGPRRMETVNRVRVPTPDGRGEILLIGDHRPLVQAGYRFYTSFNKGFAPVFVWRREGEAPLRGSVHLPAYPLHEYRQANSWTPPGAASEVWVQLQIEGEVLPADRPSRFAPPRDYRLVARIGEERHELRPGDTLRLPEGELVFEGLTTWMGYQVFYDPTLPWLLAAALVGAGALAWHYVAKFRKRSWEEAA